MLKRIVRILTRKKPNTFYYILDINMTFIDIT